MLPPSLKWLIVQRGRVDGKIAKAEQRLLKKQLTLEKHQRVIQKIEQEISTLKETLSAVDKTLSLHEIQVDPENIPTIHGHEKKRDMPRGEITRAIYKKLIMANGQPVSSKEIMDFVAQRRQELGLPPIPVWRQVHNRLNGLYHADKLIRHHPENTWDYGWWSLADHTSQYIQTPADGLGHSRKMPGKYRRT